MRSQKVRSDSLRGFSAYTCACGCDMLAEVPSIKEGRHESYYINGHGPNGSPQFPRWAEDEYETAEREFARTQVTQKMYPVAPREDDFDQICETFLGYSND